MFAFNDEKDQAVRKKLYEDCVAKLKVDNKWKQLDDRISRLKDQKIWRDEIAYVFALQKENDHKNFVESLSSINPVQHEFWEEIRGVLVEHPQHATELLLGLSRLKLHPTIHAEQGEEDNLELLLNHPAEANLFAIAMIKLHEMGRLNEMTRFVLDSSPQNALEFAQSGGQIPDDFKAEATTTLSRWIEKLEAGGILNEENAARTREILGELKDLNLLDRNMIFVIVAQEAESFLSFIENLLTVSRIGLPADIQRELIKATPRSADSLLSGIVELCELQPSLYLHESMRHAIIKNEPFQPISLIIEWISILKQANCFNAESERASVQQLPHLRKLLKSVKLLKKNNILNEVTALALLKNPLHADKLSHGLAQLATDPTLYAESYRSLINFPASADEYSNLYLELKKNSAGLPLAASCSVEVIQALGIEVIKRSFHLGPSFLEQMGKNNLLIQKVGVAFINFTNQSTTHLPTDLTQNVAMAIADLKDIDHVRRQDTSSNLLQESTMGEASDEIVEDTYMALNWSALKPHADSFNRFFDTTFHEANQFRKWHDIYSVMASALNNVHYNKKEFQHLLPTEVKPEQGMMKFSKLIGWGNKIIQQLNPHPEELKNELKEVARTPSTKQASGLTLSDFLDISDVKTLKTFADIENTPFATISLVQLHLLNKIIKKVPPQSFYKEGDKYACIEAIRNQIMRKDPEQKFFTLKLTAFNELVNSILGKDESADEDTSHDSLKSSSPILNNPSKQ